MTAAARNIPIIIWADLQIAPLGQRSLLLADLAGRPVLRNTLERICRSKQSGRKIVFCPPVQAQRIKTIANDLAVEVMGTDFQYPGWWPGVQAARKWTLAGWRGGILGACAFDEDLLPHVLSAIAHQIQVRAVMTVPAHAAWVDPAVLDLQIDQYLAHEEDYKFNFTQAPPGLAGYIIATEILDQLPRTSKIAGAMIGYQPDRPLMDLIAKPCNLKLDPFIIQTPIRFTCDTQRSLDLARELAQHIDPLSADMMQVVDSARKVATTMLTRFPQEIEIELNSGWPWPKGYRPTPEKSRGPIDSDKIVSRVAELAETCDDLLVYLGGFGEPSNHPQFEQIVQGLKQAGVFGIGMQTTALFKQDIIEKIVTLPIDTLNILIDIPSRDLYRTVTGVDEYEKVLERIQQLTDALQAHRRPIPLLVPEMIKTFDTMELMDEFFDGYIRKMGWAVINGYSDYAGQIPDLAVNSMAGPRRKNCRQILSRMTILADGQVTICNQDFNARIPVGSIQSESLRNIWQGKKLTELRSAHLAGHFECNQLCKMCRQWHRP